MKNKSQPNNENEEIIEKVQKLMEERGRKPLEMVRKAILEEEIESKEVKEALHYFITEYWHDLARPTLMSICCEAVGGDPNATIPFAVPLSLISGALDIQDDIIDQSKTKHGRPTVYGKYGKEIALLVADALLFKGFTLLHKACTQIPMEKAIKIMEIVKNAFYELGDAEALELNLRRKSDVTPEEYLHIIKKKAADVEAHTRIGAIIGDATKKEQENLGKYGRLLGMIIIIRDDIADLLDIEEAKHRILQEHLPLPAIYALNTQKNILSTYASLKEESFLEENLEVFLRKVEESGGFKLAKEFMEQIANQALCNIEIIHQGNLRNRLSTLLRSAMIV